MILTPVLIFELGKVQVFCYQTEQEFINKTPYREVFWQDKETKFVYGPFASIHNAMTHCTGMTAPKGPATPEDSANVINVNFKTKLRVL